jgi:NADH:ubiquinone oxidoreductase subunit E
MTPEETKKKPSKAPITIKVCHGHACSSNMSHFTFDRAKAELGITDSEGGLSESGRVKLEKCPCRSNCKNGPTVVIERQGKEQMHSRVVPVEMGKLLKNIK